MQPSHPHSALTATDLNNLEAEIIQATIIIYYPRASFPPTSLDSSLEVLSYLLLHPEDRTALRHEACRRSPTTSSDYYVWHICLDPSVVLTVNSYDTDQQLVTRIIRRVLEIEVQQGQTDGPHRRVLVPEGNCIVQDPFGLVEDMEQMEQ